MHVGKEGLTEKTLVGPAIYVTEFSGRIKGSYAVVRSATKVLPLAYEALRMISLSPVVYSPRLSRAI